MRGPLQGIDDGSDAITADGNDRTRNENCQNKEYADADGNLLFHVNTSDGGIYVIIIGGGQGNVNASDLSQKNKQNRHNVFRRRLLFFLLAFFGCKQYNILNQNTELIVWQK